MQKIDLVFHRFSWSVKEEWEAILAIYLPALKEYDLFYDYKAERCGRKTIYRFRSWPRREHDILSLDALRNQVAKALALHMYRYMKGEWLRYILTREFRYVQKQAVKQIMKTARWMMSDRETVSAAGSIVGLQKQLYEEMADCLEQHHVLDVCGFQRFRLQKYKPHVQDIIQHSIDEYIIEKEYRDFIRLLRYFLSVRIPKIDILHMVHREERRFILYDKDLMLLDPDQFPGGREKVKNIQNDGEDMIISTLIYLAPRQLILHTNATTHNLIYTIRQVFKDRIRICWSCPTCQTEHSPH